jgi:hypothetical protein
MAVRFLSEAKRHWEASKPGPAELGVGKSRIPLFPTLTKAAAVRRGGTTSVPTQRPMVNRGRRCLFQAEASPT